MSQQLPSIRTIQSGVLQHMVDRLQEYDTLVFLYASMRSQRALPVLILQHGAAKCVLTKRRPILSKNDLKSFWEGSICICHCGHSPALHGASHGELFFAASPRFPQWVEGTGSQ